MKPLTIKDQIRKLLASAGVYERVKASMIYDLYWGIADKQILADRKKEIDFYRHLLQGFHRGDLIFDIGANQGYKTDIFSRMGARVIAVEPDDTAQRILSQKFFQYRLSKKPITIVPKAVSDRNSTATMWIDSPGNAKNTLNPKWVDSLKNDKRGFEEKLTFGQSKQVETTSLEQLITTFGSPFFVKIDVEGFELNVLRGLKSRVPYLSFEVNLPEFREEGLQCINVLYELAADGRFNYAIDCRLGLCLQQWASAQQISEILASCNYPSVELFWNNSVSR